MALSAAPRGQVDLHKERPGIESNALEYVHHGRKIELKNAQGASNKIRQIHNEMEQIRRGGSGVGKLARDITLREHLAVQYQTSPEALYAELGIDPNITTMDFLLTLDEDHRYIVPEIFRDAIRLGYLMAPIFPNLIASSETIAQPTLQMPSINLASATPDTIREVETISQGTITYQSKSVKVNKQGIGIRISYEAIQYSSLNLIAMFFQDMGLRLGRALDISLMSVATAGDQADGSQSAATPGVTTPYNGASPTGTGIQYADLIRVFVRMNFRNRPSSVMVGNEDMINWLLNLPEIKNRQNPYTPLFGLNLQSPVPHSQDIYVQTSLAENQLLFVDSTKAFIQLTAQPLLVESERLVQRQINGTYATITTGFANLFRDARVYLDGTNTFSTVVDNAHGWPSWMSF